ncbi:NAD-dependent epimerase/dehydratase family protein [Actinomadura sp. 7K507]|uniref:NAD-dependent epimerase/dehydratase family protein n=1 Tax=Actinomadura sp. 7K507 TaxID=2530365 RepID=UPI0014043653|nr:NAD-dependent epimerase/dehydratase family protein [Actinomadura sp. 7K507]
MRYLIIGCGHIGTELARRWTSAGHQVTGTTTSPGRVEKLREICTDAAVLRGADLDAVTRAAEGADAIVLTVSPRLQRSFDAAQRVAEYADTLTASARTAVTAHPRVVFTSSSSVYGAGEGALIDEETPTTTDSDASPRNFVAAEQAVLASPRGAVVRIPDVYGHPDDIDYPTRVKFAHDVLGGSVPFSADALLYRVDYRDAAAAIDFVVTQGLTGVYNAVPDETVPPTNAAAFAEICAAAGLPGLTYRGEIRTPSVPVTSAKLRAAGFAFSHPAAAPAG